MTDECDEKHDNLVAMSYEDDQQCIQFTEDQGIEDYHSDFYSHFSCLEFLFQEEIFSPTCSEVFDDQEHTLAKVHYEERSEAREKGTLFLLDQQEVNFHVFQDPVAILYSHQ